MSLYGNDKMLMGIAKAEVTAAMPVLPPAWIVNFLFKLSEGDAAKLEKAATAWEKTAQEISGIITSIRDTAGKLAKEDWNAESRQMFEQKVDAMCEQLEQSRAFCEVVKNALLVCAAALLAYAVFAAAMGAYLAVLAAVFVAAIAGVVTAPAASSAMATAGVCLKITYAATAVLGGVLSIAGSIFGIHAWVTSGRQEKLGNTEARADFKQAMVSGGVTALTNLAQNAANTGLAYVNRFDMPHKPSGLPLQKIDLDADRNKDGTWTVGGGGTVGRAGSPFSIEGGGNIKFSRNDGDFLFNGLGAEGKYSHTPPGGPQWSAGGKLDYSDEDGVFQGPKNGELSGGLNGEWGIGNGGAKLETEGKKNFEDGSWKISGSGGGTYQGGDVAGYKGEYEVNEKGEGQYQGTFNNPIYDILHGGDQGKK
ncbi:MULTISPECIES: hypothetical protein [Thermomonospora]|uniref:Uncharacterized protein n=1 Tax=Thermomonospora curvata (strain ATCC 19995 / DSM 43183 / JCM 3096 / KCTC 9072 / NBRC 15933 / NCIMB 10081 / Henssen B9) TaxID=471852 RepID=D1A8B2_THECD|nr:MULTISPECIES: hypothetical protein [Thermomonospora]ACZ00427.1 hypothetical protein Tcur_4911 [Thermomonospora curvata DSM 43183]PKK11810.1 MAG: hypothetical protein BUE48_023720 [Thermomonospora sp. CIF 1]